jgi:hypothetical protein
MDWFFIVGTFLAYALGIVVAVGVPVLLVMIIIRLNRIERALAVDRSRNS